MDPTEGNWTPDCNSASCPEQMLIGTPEREHDNSLQLSDKKY